MENCVSPNQFYSWEEVNKKNKKGEVGLVIPLPISKEIKQKLYNWYYQMKDREDVIKKLKDNLIVLGMVSKKDPLWLCIYVLFCFFLHKKDKSWNNKVIKEGLKNGTQKGNSCMEILIGNLPRGI